jgi:hypothetical protein
MLEGGFFLVDRNISEDSFVFKRTAMSAEKTERMTRVFEVSRGFIRGLLAGRELNCFCGVETPERELNIEEKNPVAAAFVGWSRCFRDSVLEV